MSDGKPLTDSELGALERQVDPGRGTEASLALRLVQDLKKARELLRKVQFGTEGLCYLCFSRRPALPDDHLPDCEVRTFLGPENKP